MSRFSRVRTAGETLKAMSAQVQPLPDPVLRREDAQVAIPMRAWAEMPDIALEARTWAGQNRAARPRVVPEAGWTVVDTTAALLQRAFAGP